MVDLNYIRLDCIYIFIQQLSALVAENVLSLLVCMKDFSERILIRTDQYKASSCISAEIGLLFTITHILFIQYFVLSNSQCLIKKLSSLKFVVDYLNLKESETEDKFNIIRIDP